MRPFKSVNKAIWSRIYRALVCLLHNFGHHRAGNVWDLPPLGAVHDEIDIPAAAFGTDQPLTPIHQPRRGGADQEIAPTARGLTQASKGMGAILTYQT
jgi:hypothetical protein